MEKRTNHTPVMPEEVKHFFSDMTGKVVVDATAGGGGHLSILAKIVSKSGTVLGFDRDVRAHQSDAALGIKDNFDNITLIKKPFSKIKEVLAEYSYQGIDGLLCDLGVSSFQLDEASRGFSLKKDGPIDMRMDQSKGQSAYTWLQNHSEKEIADALFKFGQERKSRAIARLIKRSWPIENSTLFLANLILRAVKPKKYHKTHPATRSFQALRIVVNDELYELNELLNTLDDIIAINGIAVFISFHSLEDRMVKNKFKELSLIKNDAHNFKYKILTKKPLTPKEDEIKQNPRSRSAKFRAIKRIG